MRIVRSHASLSNPYTTSRIPRALMAHLLLLLVAMRGEVEAVVGSVVDVRFEPGPTPGIREALEVDEPRRRLLEVQAQLAPGLVRTPVLGLPR